jgi:hypothetical protein
MRRPQVVQAGGGIAGLHPLGEDFERNLKQRPDQEPVRGRLVARTA